MRAIPRLKILLPVVGMLFGLLLIAGGVAWLVNRDRAADALAGPDARWALFFPTGQFAGCARYGIQRYCSSTPTGNINDGGKVVARGVLLRADGEQFQWTVSPDEVEAANTASRTKYLACVSSGRSDCPEPVFRTPSWNSGMRVRWAPGADGAYLPGAEPGGSDSLTIAIFLLVAGGLVTAGSGVWMRSAMRRRGAA